MKALILAAGRGTRLGALTQNQPKPMIPIAGVPMVERIMTMLDKEGGITEFVLVTGYLAEVIQAYFGDGSKWGWKVQYAHQAEQKGVAHAVNCASDLLSDSDFFMTFGDIMLDPSNYKRGVEEYVASNTGDKSCKTIVGMNWVEDPYRGSAIYMDDDNVIDHIDEKPPKGTATSHWNSAGLFVFDPMIFKYTSTIAPSARGEYEMPDAITALIKDGYTAKGLPVTGDWRDVGTPEDYDAINAEYGAAK
jgi:dTDP-glucose pyrophosphorylase